MMKKYIAMLLALVMVFSFSGCGFSSKKEKATEAKEEVSTTVDDDSLKVGFLLPSDASSHYTEARELAMDQAMFNLGMTESQFIVKQSVTEDSINNDIESMISNGCRIIFSCYPGFEDAVVAAAGNHPEVEFCQEDGDQAAACGLENMHNYFSKIYEAYYVMGAMAGSKINDLLNRGEVSPYECMVGFVASEDDAENASCYTAFNLGIKRVCSQAHMYVRVVGSSGVYDDDGEAALQLVQAGACVIATHVYTSAAATVCAEYSIPVFGNEVSVIEDAPKKAVTSSMTDWSVYFEECITQVMNGQDIPTDWCKGYKEHVVGITQLNDAHIKTNMIEKAQEVEAGLCDGSIQVFDTSKFTIGGESLAALAASSDDYKMYKALIKDGIFMESSKQSKPIFHHLIDGIEISTYDYLEEYRAAHEEATTEDATTEDGTIKEEEE